MDMFPSPWGGAWRNPALNGWLPPGRQQVFRDISAVESGALVDFFNATNGTGWNDNSGWPGQAGYTGLAADASGVTVTGGAVTHLNKSGDSGLAGDGLAALGPLSSMTSLFLNDTCASGDLGDLSPLTSLILLYLHRNYISGDVGGLAALTSLSQLYLYSGQASIYGDISGLSSLTGLTSLQLYGPNVTVSGDIVAFSGMTSMRNMSLIGCAGIYGGLGVLFPLRELLYLSFGRTSISGGAATDISAMADITTLVSNIAKIPTVGQEAIIASLYAGKDTRDPMTINIASQTDPDTGLAAPTNAATEAMIVELTSEPYNWTITYTPPPA